MKKVISAFLAVVFVFSLLPCAFADEAAVDAAHETAAAAAPEAATEAKQEYYTLTLDAGEGVFIYSIERLKEIGLNCTISPEGNIAYVSYKEGDMINAFGCTPNRKGYYFQGWSPEVPANMPAKDVKVEAVWSDKPGQLISCVCIKYNQAKRGEKLNSNFTAISDHIKLSPATSWKGFDSEDKEIATLKEGDLVPDKADKLVTNLFIKADKGYYFNGDTTVIFNSHSGLTKELHLHRLFETNKDVSVLRFEINQTVTDGFDFMRFFTFLPIDVAKNVGQWICAVLGKNVFPLLLFSPLKWYYTEDIR